MKIDASSKEPERPSFERLAPGADVVRIVALAADAAPSPVDPLSACLSALERQRLAGITHERRRREYVAARVLVRTALAEALDVSAGSLEFVVDPHGKPRLAGDHDLHFNLSHSGDWLVCAIARGRAVGVDIERSTKERRLVELAQRYFAPAEADHVARLVGAEQESAFYSLWTLKEAYVKAIGRGLSFPLDSFAFRLDVHRLIGFDPPPDERPDRWHFHQFDLDDRHRGALVVEARNLQLAVEHLRWESR